MGEGGWTDKHTDRHTDRRINTMAQPGLGAGPSENKYKKKKNQFLFGQLKEEPL